MCLDTVSVILVMTYQLILIIYDVIVSNMVCQHLVNSPIKGMIYRGLPYLLQVESILSPLALQAEEGGSESQRLDHQAYLQ